MAEAETAALLPPERRAKILDLITRDKSVLVKDLCALFSVTGETVRKDLSVLEQEGRLIKTYGGAYIQDGTRNEIDVTIRETVLPEIKDAIARACVPLVSAGDTVFLDESTTCLAVARRLCGVEDLTVVTNSLNAARLLDERSACRLILSGGELDRKNRSFVGSGAEAFLRNFYVDKCFVSCRRLDREAGLTDGAAAGGAVRCLMLHQARSRILVLDSTKLDRPAFYRIGGFELVDIVVVDSLGNSPWRDFFAQRGIRVIETAAAE